MEGVAKILDGMETNFQAIEGFPKDLPSNISNNNDAKSFPECDKSLAKETNTINSSLRVLDDVHRLNESTGNSVSYTASSTETNKFSRYSSLLPTDGTTLQQIAHEELNDGGELTLSEPVTRCDASHFPKHNPPSLTFPLIDNIILQSSNTHLPKLSHLNSSPALLEFTTDVKLSMTRQTTISRAGSF